MEKEKHPICPAIWFSGFFGLGTLVHLVRWILRVPVTLGTWEVPLGFSALAVLVFGGLSLGLLSVGLRRPCCGSDKTCESKSV